MTDIRGAGRAAQVRTMFGRITRRYDLMNRLMTVGQDVGWRRLAIDLAALPPGGRLLDIGAGTGDLAREASRRDAALQVVCADFTLEMMLQGRPRAGAERLRWTLADALQLPFRDAEFDAVTSGFLIRNVVDIPQAWAEQLRVLKPGGRVVCLETSRPRSRLLRPLIALHVRTVVPALGRLVAGSPGAYRYLSKTMESFLSPEDLARSMTAAGFRNVGFRRLMLGTAAIHWGEK